LTEPLSIAEKAVNEAISLQQGRLGPDAWKTPPRVLVTGMGPIGFTSILACIARQWPVTMYGRDAEDSQRASLARALGAQYVPGLQDGPHRQSGDEQRFDLILECTGSDEVLTQVAPSLAACGIMVWLGSSRMPQARTHNLDVLMRHAILRNHIHLGTVNAAPRDFVDAIQHLGQLHKTHRREVEAIITARVSLADALWHYTNRQPQGIKIVVQYGSEGRN
jgi:threonine dehydrogenase-like Zn-dependent dehydrogenase